MADYYNEIEPYAAQWLRNLIAAGNLPEGDVDTRSIADVRPDDLAGYTQCHFFAGIGGWPLALRMAGWPADRRVWTGSCPCQPFSAAGKGAGFADERHLWPAFFRLIRECGPDSVFGEQVASNLAWLDLVSGDLEGEGYAVGSAIVGAHSVGAPHIRQRLYWVAQSDEGQRGRQPVVRGHERDRAQAGWLEGYGEPEPRGEDGSNGVADADGRHTSAERQQRSGEQRQQPSDGGAGNRMAHDNAPGRSLERRGGLLDGERQALGDDADGRGQDDWLGDHGSVGREVALFVAGRGDAPGEQRQASVAGSAGHDGRGLGDGERAGLEGLAGHDDGAARREDQDGSAWAASVLVECADGRWRPVPTEPGLFPLAHGVPGRVGRLRAYGNAIVPQTAAAFVRAAM